MKKITKITAFILCAVILSLSAAVFASAEPSGTSEPEYQMITRIPVSASLYVGENLHNPAVKVGFSFTKNNTTPDFFSFDDSTGNTISFDANSVAAGTTAKISVALNINNYAFTSGGIYNVLVNEVYDDDANEIYAVKGVAYDTTSKYAYFYVGGNPDYDSSTEAGREQPEYMCYAVIVTTENKIPTLGENGVVANKLSDGEIPFFNSYSSSDDPGPGDDPNYPTGKLLKLTGNNEVWDNAAATVANNTKEINYTVKVIADASDRIITVVPSVGESFEIDSATASAGFSIKLKHDQSFTIHGLVAGERFEMVITNAKEYTLNTSRSATDTLVDFSGNSVTKTVSATMAKDAYVTFINKRQITIPTGIFLNYKHYWVMLGAALLLVVAFVGKRRNRVENEI